MKERCRVCLGDLSAAQVVMSVSDGLCISKRLALRQGEGMLYPKIDG